MGGIKREVETPVVRKLRWRKRTRKETSTNGRPDVRATAGEEEVEVVRPMPPLKDLYHGGGGPTLRRAFRFRTRGGAPSCDDDVPGER